MDDLNVLSFSVTRGGTGINIPNIDLAQHIQFTTLYPGGLYGDCTFVLPGDPRISCPLVALDFVQIWCGLELAWEGEVTGLEASTDGETVGWLITCMGLWSTRLMARKVAKPWVDDRFDDSTWPSISYGAANSVHLFSVDRDNRIRVTPNEGVAYASGAVAWFAYYAVPAGQTIKRITFNFDVQEAAQSWTAGLRNVTAAANEWTRNTSGTGSQDITFATPTAALNFFFQSDVAQTGIGDGTIYAQVTSLVIYTETGAINPQEIVIDCAQLAGLSADLTLIGFLTDAVSPFVILPARSLADIATEAAAYGSTANAGWAVSVWRSVDASDGNPPMLLQPIPSLAVETHTVSLGAPNIQPGTRFTQDVNEVINYYHLTYTAANGREVNLSPSDDAGLKDDTSINAYGARHSESMSINTTSSALAIRYGKTRLAQTKDLKWKASGDIVATGYVELAGGGMMPAATMSAGYVLLVTDYMTDSANEVRLLVTATRYDHDARQVSISTGYPDTVEAWLARQLRGK